jgi:hypothetical protein
LAHGVEIYFFAPKGTASTVILNWAGCCFLVGVLGTASSSKSQNGLASTFVPGTRIKNSSPLKKPQQEGFE